MDNQQMTIGDFLDFWLEKVIRKNVCQSTYMAYKGYVENHLSEYLAEETFISLKAETVQGIVAKLQAKQLANKTVRSIVLMLRSALKCAVDYAYIANNPCDKVRLPKLNDKETVIFSKNAQRQLEKAIVNSNDTRSYGVMICLYTGLRIGELCGLKWDCVDFKRKTIEIKNSLNRVNTYAEDRKRTILLETPPKTKKSRRVIPMPSFLCQLLREMKQLSCSDYVLSMKSGKAVEPRLMQTLYAKLLQSAGLEYVNFHALRHTFATRAIETGADVKAVSEILGHANTMITVNLYAHSLFEQKRRCMERLSMLYKAENALIP